MTGDELRAIADEIGWSLDEVGRRLGGRGGRHVRRWAKGEYPVPERVEVWLLGVRDAIAAVPIDPKHRPKIEEAA